MLASLVGDAASHESPQLLLPDFPGELLQSFVSLVYRGRCPLSSVTTPAAIHELMMVLGFRDELILDPVNGFHLRVSVSNFQEDQLPASNNQQLASWQRSTSDL